MNDKQQIQKLKDNAELAMAAYGYFDLKTSDTNQLFLVLKDEKGKDRVDASRRPVTQQITLTDIMNITYKNYEVYKPSPLSTLSLKK
ncbi:hypothetical protein [Helicobacter trogontum]|uniref:Uncharacterized protein n=1 Tax=Helicobacter trogontum TaxID=50960 RepID=A0ABQ0D6Y9_9HELI|nr:hypothetical protein [Helicobacter trogontum]